MDNNENIKKIVRNYVDEIAQKINNIDKIEEEPNTKSDDYSSFDFSVDSASSDNFCIVRDQLVSILLRSKDRSTRNIGALLGTIAQEFPSYLQSFIDKVKNNLDYSSGEIKYVGEPFDEITLQSTVIILRRTLSRKETSEAGVSFFNKTIDGEKDADYEFYMLNSMLKPYTTLQDQNMLDYLLRVLSNSFEHGDKEEALDNMKKLASMVIFYGLKVRYINAYSFYNPETNTIFINRLFSSPEISLHELGHAIDKYYSQRDKKSTNEDVLAKAREKLLDNPKSAELINSLNMKIKFAYDSAAVMYDREMMEKFGNIENAYLAFERYAIEMINKGQIHTLFAQYNVPENIKMSIIEDLRNGRLNIKRFAVTLYNSDRNLFLDRYFYAKKEGAILDIISAVFKGRVISMKDGSNIYLNSGHTTDYYKSYNDASIAEIIANINALAVNGEKEVLDLLGELLGDEFMDFIMKERNTSRIVKTDNKKEGREVV